jgi:pyroglutamyl-peptidase
MAATILITGFGPFPGAPFNPTGALVEKLARLRRPILADVTIVPHIFRTSYAIVDDELPKLIAKHRPDALLMFGLAQRAKAVRIETRARNALTSFPDVSGHSLQRRSIVSGGPSALLMPARTRHLFAAARNAQIPVVVSRDAGRYLCNYLCWRATEASAQNGPRFAAFVHVPLTSRTVRRSKKRGVLTLDELLRAAEQFLVALATATQRTPRLGRKSAVSGAVMTFNQN